MTAAGFLGVGGRRAALRLASRSMSCSRLALVLLSCSRLALSWVSTPAHERLSQVPLVVAAGPLGVCPAGGQPWPLAKASAEPLPAALPGAHRAAARFASAHGAGLLALPSAAGGPGVLPRCR